MSRFKEITEAHTTLSDANERAWYDSHREQILRGGTGLDDDDDGVGIDLFKYFTGSCYKGYGDDDGGFYSVYSKVFQEIDALEEADESVDEVRRPQLGCQLCGLRPAARTVPYILSAPRARALAPNPLARSTMPPRCSGAARQTGWTVLPSSTHTGRTFLRRASSHGDVHVCVCACVCLILIVAHVCSIIIVPYVCSILTVAYVRLILLVAHVCLILLVAHVCLILLVAHVTQVRQVQSQPRSYYR